MPDSEKHRITTPESRPSSHPKGLSPEYHKAHKQLMLWAAILFVWEFVGIDLEKAKDAEGYVGALIKAVKSPQAIPWALLLLVGYFLFKVTIEWFQCNRARRNMRGAQLDFISGWTVSLLACVFYFGQAISHVQFADLLEAPSSRYSLFLGLFTGLTVATAVAIFLPQTLADLFIERPRIALIPVAVGAVALWTWAVWERTVNWTFVLVGTLLALFIAGFPTGKTILNVVSRYRHSSRHADLSKK